MNHTQKTIALAIGSAFALSIAATSVNAAENPFSIKPLASGYQVADNQTSKMKDGKCGAGKCGANMKKMNKGKDSACCHHNKAKDGSCSAEKMKEGACSAEMKKEMDSKAAEGQGSTEQAK